MPLSEHEQRLLDQIERALYQEDPKFASTVKATDLRTHLRRRLWRSVALLVVGFGLLLGGVVSRLPLVGVMGFVVMLAALLLALSSWKRLAGRAPSRAAAPGSASSPRHPSVKQAGSVLHRLEDRWKRRWDDRGRP